MPADDPALRPFAFTCSTIVATRFRTQQLERCLTALDALPNPPTEVIVVDNSDGDDDTLRVANEHGAQYIVASGTGLSGARNVGARLASGDILAFIDDDAAPTAGWVEALCEPFVDPFVGAVAGRIVPTEVVSEAQRWSVAVHWKDLGSVRRTFNLTTSDWFEKANFGGIGVGANMAFRRRVFEEWPGFRESFGLGAPLPGGEENYAFFELISLGFTVVYTPDAVVDHPLPGTFSELRSRRRLLLGQALAYMTLLVREEPEFRWRIGRYALHKGVRRLRSRPQPDQPSWRTVILPTDVLAAVGRAPVLVWRCIRRAQTPAAGVKVRTAP